MTKKLQFVAPFVDESYPDLPLGKLPIDVQEQLAGAFASLDKVLSGGHVGSKPETILSEVIDGLNYQLEDLVVGQKAIIADKSDNGYAIPVGPLKSTQWQDVAASLLEGYKRVLPPNPPTTFRKAVGLDTVEA